jgi:hypothetical protein
MLVVLGFLDGVESAQFGIGAVFSLIVVYDAFGVRRAVGEQGGVLSRLIELTRTPKAERESFKIREVLGHTPLEVFAGGLLGWFVSTLLMYNYWPEWARDLLNKMGELEQNVYLGIFVGVWLLGIIVNRYYGRRILRKLPTSKRVQRIVRNSFIVPAVLGLITLWLQNESIRFFTTKIWILGAVIWLLVIGTTNYFRVIRGSKVALSQEVEHFKKDKKISRKVRIRKKHKRKK